MRSHPGTGRLAAAGIAVVALIAAALVAAFGLAGAESPAGSSELQGWERLPDPPLAPRSNVIAVWTGREALFVGGDTFICPPSTSCTGDGVTVFSDGAAFDPTTQTWRLIADAPVPLPAAASAVVVDDDVYVLVEEGRARSPAFLRYSIADDSWTSLPVLPVERLGWYRLVATDISIVAYAMSHEGGASGDFVVARGSARPGTGDVGTAARLRDPRVRTLAPRWRPSCEPDGRQRGRRSRQQLGSCVSFWRHLRHEHAVVEGSAGGA